VAEDENYGQDYASRGNEARDLQAGEFEH
jgi:hypothetical protein